ncbi:mannose-1-phosphate guanylyltransferase (GDP) /mannose-6-phosphate isomerase type 2 [Enterobacillus tribolii]|uniref:mannose-1-phosphate guanylyltransferase n=2 Tax=Enterobacillus tribolii TaxID=1487935 RepID=A0A370R2Q6_9GAMM|nr:mannose-1-phosphate guanylyltransferase/mannose-6-phosphate isomerase [Enterobacillus tribolii]RDK96696.1 mannose-1-phosphate guanylyltransferase (GDP) /mannose-6-phosphate isomerase type 2 [Enterobacillus tribolii]
MNIIPVIMAGGSGSRLWPLSRDSFPKQFLSIDGSGSSMLENTLDRLHSESISNPIVICNESHRFIVAEQLRKKNKLEQNIILEPSGRNTAPAVALAALHCLKTSNGNDPLMLVLAADHVILKEDIFLDAVMMGTKYAADKHLVTFGIVPDSPETGYGYIKSGMAKGDNVFEIERFIEKPNRISAECYLNEGGYYWNSGMFLFQASSYLNELKEYRPDIYDCCLKAYETSNNDSDFLRVGCDEFLHCPAESIDYAVMEKTKNGLVIPMSVGWSDVGSWSSLWDIQDKDEHNNVRHGDVITLNSNNNYIFSSNALVTTIGVENLVIVQTEDAVLVAEQSNVQRVKDIVNTLKINERREFKTHKTLFRPWGTISALSDGNGYSVKKLHIRPGEGMSMQVHYNRSEHWIVLSGTARVIVGGEEKLLTTNHAINIDVGIPHTIENPGRIMLEMIEIQTGSYIQDDDVIRLNDRYGR